jgi:hypothetical protein
LSSLPIDSPCCIVTFETIHEVLRAEKALTALGLAFELVPVPPAITSDCGFCILAPWAEEGLKSAIEALSAGTIAISGAYRVLEKPSAEGRHKEKAYERIK